MKHGFVYAPWNACGRCMLTFADVFLRRTNGEIEEK